MQGSGVWLSEASKGFVGAILLERFDEAPFFWAFPDNLLQQGCGFTSLGREGLRILMFQRNCDFSVFG